MASDPTAVDTATLIASAYRDLAAINTKLWDAADMIRDKATLLLDTLYQEGLYNTTDDMLAEVLESIEDALSYHWKGVPSLNNFRIKP